MSNPLSKLNQEEEKLLRAAVAHARLPAVIPSLEIRRIPYGFETNLPKYGEAKV